MEKQVKHKRNKMCKRTAAVAAFLTFAVLSAYHIKEQPQAMDEPSNVSSGAVAVAFVPGMPSVPHDRQPIMADPLPVAYKAAESVSALSNVPLDADVQEQIKTLCEGHGIDPAIIYAMMWRESRFDADAVGDNGQSFGLLQIQKKWHEERMERLGVTDLFDPVQNATVAVDLLAELMTKYDGSLNMALTAYNCGTGGAYKNFFQYGVYSNEYSDSVIEKASEYGAER